MSGSFDLSNQVITFSCPKCDFVNSVRLKDIERGITPVCVGCLRNINLIDKDNSLHTAIKDVNRSINELSETVRKIGK